MKKENKIVGYWYSKISPEYPMPEPDNVIEDKEIFLEKLRKLQKRAAVKYYKGFSKCRICNCINGTIEYSVGGFTWPDGYIHYIEDHDVLPDEDFYNYVMK